MAASKKLRSPEVSSRTEASISSLLVIDSCLAFCCLSEFSRASQACPLGRQLAGHASHAVGVGYDRRFVVGVHRSMAIATDVVGRQLPGLLPT